MSHASYRYRQGLRESMAEYKEALRFLYAMNDYPMPPTKEFEEAAEELWQQLLTRWRGLDARFSIERAAERAEARKFVRESFQQLKPG